MRRSHFDGGSAGAAAHLREQRVLIVVRSILPCLAAIARNAKIAEASSLACGPIAPRTTVAGRACKNPRRFIVRYCLSQYPHKGTAKGPIRFEVGISAGKIITKAYASRGRGA